MQHLRKLQQYCNAENKCYTRGYILLQINTFEKNCTLISTTDHETFNKTITSLTGSVSSIWNSLNTGSDPSQRCIVNDTVQCTVNDSSSASAYWKYCFTPRVNLSLENVRIEYYYKGMGFCLIITCMDLMQ